MKKIIFSILMLVTLSIAACSSSVSGIQANATLASAELPIATQLVVGTLKLDDTEQAVSGDQAQDLLVLWQAYLALTGSDTASQAEIDALIVQIQETMTDEQMKDITAMDLAQQDVMTLIQEQGGGVSSSEQSDSNSLQTGASSPPPDGGIGDMAGGAPPDGGMAGMAGTGQSASADQNQEVAAAPITATRTPTTLVEALIQVLEQKTLL